ncbi:TetR/AcrR family transcriptional regulator [Aeromicrobium sp. P5_D10]
MERKPGRPRALTVDVIAQAALDDGVDQFSMPSVARRLGVAHSGLYRYVTDRDDLLIHALDRAHRTTTWPGSDLGWEELVREIGEAVWRVCDAFPGLDRASQLASRPAPALLEQMSDWVSTVQGQGFEPEDAAVAVEFPISLALDSSIQMSRLRKIQTAHPEEILDAYSHDEVWEGRGLYSRKLDIFIAGLALRRRSS